MLKIIDPMVVHIDKETHVRGQAFVKNISIFGNDCRKLIISVSLTGISPLAQKKPFGSKKPFGLAKGTGTKVMSSFQDYKSISPFE